MVTLENKQANPRNCSLRSMHRVVHSTVPCYNMFITLRPCVEVHVLNSKKHMHNHSWGWHKPCAPDLVNEVYKYGLQI